MKKYSALLLIAALLFSSPAFAGIEVNEDGTFEGNVSKINLSTGLNGVKAGGLYTITADPSDITSAVFEGTTADAYETTLAVVDPTADQTISLPDDTGYVMFSTLATNKTQVANSVWFISNGMVLEGATADAYETTLSPVDPTADQTVSIANAGVANALLFTTLTTNTIDAANSFWGASNSVVFEGATADAFETTVAPSDVTADATITLPTKTGVLHASGAATALTPGATPTLTVVAGRHVVTYQPADNTDATFNASGAGSAGDEMIFIFTTDAAGSGDEVMTFGTNFYSTGTLTMANLAADIYVVSFISNGTRFVEKSRTTVQTT